jgi:L-lactate dehydrogenase
MNIGIIGIGWVGKSCAMATILRGCARTVVLLDKNQKLAEAVAKDMQYGILLSPRTSIVAGEYNDLKDAALVIITAGVNEKTGGATDRHDATGRLKLLSTNAKIYEDIIPKVVQVAPNAVLLVVTDPPDPLADVARHLAGHDRIISAGTYLDTLRFKFHLAEAFNLNPMDVEALVIGEHGTSSVFLWSSVTIGGKPLDDLLTEDKVVFQKQIVDTVKFANIAIIEGNNASQYGIGMVCARLAESILRDERSVVPVGSYHPDFGITFSLPSVIGARGVEQTFMPALSKDELQSLQQCAHVLKNALKNSDILSKKP